MKLTLDAVGLDILKHRFCVNFNPNSHVCPDVSKYIFWDCLHPTQKAYYNISASCN